MHPRAHHLFGGPPPLLLPLLLQAFAFVIPFATSNVELLDPTLPPVLPAQTPECSVAVLNHDFSGTVGSPLASVQYKQPPDCSAPWTRVVLELSMVASGTQKHRVAAVWVDGAEILRTSTPLPTAASSFWKVQKDVSRYAAVLHRLADGGTVSMMLDNSDADASGVFFANVSFHFYRGALPDESAARPGSLKLTAHPTVRGLYRDPADLVIPVSREDGSSGYGFWFQIDGNRQVVTAPVAVPKNTYRAVLEIFASYHADDEFWYMNPVRSSYDAGGMGGVSPANGGFRQLYATIDGRFDVGGHVPFAVIYSGSINPYLWSPVAAIGAFDMPSYDIELTPFLELLLDGRPHEIGIGVKQGQNYWLLTANLHLWVDRWSDSVQARMVAYTPPNLKVNSNGQWHNPDGESEVDAEGQFRFAGWVSSSRGNITTVVRQKVRFKSEVSVHNRGAVRQAHMVNKERMTVEMLNGKRVVGRVQRFMEAPLQVHTSTVVNVAGGVSLEKTRLSHELQETEYVSEKSRVSMSAVSDRQDAEGSVMAHGEEAVWGSGSSRSVYKYRDESGCYLRAVNADNGAVKGDVASRSCSASAVANA